MNTNGTRPRPTESTVLVATDPRRIARILRNRQVLDKMKEEEEERVGMGGDSSKNKKLAASVIAWLPYGEGGFIRKRELKHAKANFGKTEMKLTRRGKVVSPLLTRTANMRIRV